MEAAMMESLEKSVNQGENEDIFINFTNHPSELWDIKQKDAAKQYGMIIDIPFPAVDPKGSKGYISELADFFVEKIVKIKPKAVLCQGEFCLAYSVINKLKEREILVLAACSVRKVIEEGNKKQVTFEFEQFREYEWIPDLKSTEKRKGKTEDER